MSLGIRAKVAVLALLCAVLPSIAISFVAFSSARQELETAAKAELSTLVAEELTRLEGTFNAAHRDLETWSALHTMQNVLLNDEDGTVSAELIRLRDRYRRFSDLLVVNPAGTIVSATEESLLGTDASSLESVANPLGGQPFTGTVAIDPLIQKPGVTISYPIRADYDEQTVIGALVGLVDWSRVQADLSKVAIWGSPQDEAHRLELHASSGELVFGDASGHDSEATIPEVPGVTSIHDRGTSLLLGTAKSSDGAWTMHAMIAEDVAFAGIAALGQRIGLLSAMIMIGAAALGALVAGRSIANPIRAVTKAMSGVAEGRTDLYLEGRSRRDEIGEMMSAIATFRHRLEDHNAALRDNEEKLRSQNVRFDTALTNMSQGLSMFDANGTLIVANPQFAEIYGLPPELTEPGTSMKSISEYLVGEEATSAENAEKYSQTVMANAHAGSPWEQEYETGDGRHIAISHRPMHGGGWVATHADITERLLAERKIAFMAQYDALTSLPNRILFRSKVVDALSDPERVTAILCLDLDRFKNVNDTLGHPIGDALLRQVASRLSEAAADHAYAARLGGDEFALVQSGLEQPGASTALAASIITALSTPFDIEGHHVDIGASIGIAIAPQDGKDPDELLKNADLALYRAKADGGGSYRIFEPEMDAKMQARRALEVALRGAIAREELHVDYQPLINISTNKIIGFEALARWTHPTRGLVRPAEFIPVAEETGLIIPIGEWVLRRACMDAASWPTDIRVSVNLSPVQFRNKNLVQTVFSALAASHLAPTRLDLEITETVLLNDSQGTLAILHQLRDLGVKISMDDFGTGYSSLSYLQKFPFSKIKIDQSFVRGLGEGEEALAIIRAVTGMSKSLGMISTAEGVETVEQLQTLKLEGCTEFQGYYASRPCSFAEATAMLEGHAKTARSA